MESLTILKFLKNSLFTIFQIGTWNHVIAYFYTYFNRKFCKLMHIIPCSIYVLCVVDKKLLFQNLNNQFSYKTNFLLSDKLVTRLLHKFYSNVALYDYVWAVIANTFASTVCITNFCVWMKIVSFCFSDVIYLKRVISDCTGTSKESVFTERTEDSSAVQYFQVRISAIISFLIIILMNIWSL